MKPKHTAKHASHSFDDAEALGLECPHGNYVGWCDDCPETYYDYVVDFLEKAKNNWKKGYEQGLKDGGFKLPTKAQLDGQRFGQFLSNAIASQRDEMSEAEADRFTADKLFFTENEEIEDLINTALTPKVK